MSELFDQWKPVLDWFETRLITVFGQGDPAEQMATSFLLATVMWLSSVVTLGVSIIAALLFTGTFLWGVYRMIRYGR